jgi:hypothetical protein
LTKLAPTRSISARSWSSGIVGYPPSTPPSQPHGSLRLTGLLFEHDPR